MSDLRQPTTSEETTTQTTTTDTDCMDRAQSLREHLLRTLSNREQLEELTGVLGFQALKNYRKSSEANREAEERAVRRQIDSASGSDSTDRDLTGGEDMANENIVLGGIHNPPAVVYPPDRGNLLPSLAAAALAAGIPLAGLAGYMYSQADADRPGYEDRETSIGLGKLEDSE